VEALSDWLTSPADRSGAAWERWRSIATQREAGAFSAVLDGWASLSEALNWNTRLAFRRRIGDVLSSLGQDLALATRCLALARDGAVSEPAALTAFLKTVEAVIDDAAAQWGRWPLPEILHLALQRFRVDVLETIVAEKAATQRYCDAADIRLAYRSGLATCVDFPEDGYGVEDFHCVAVRDEDILAARMRLVEAEQSERMFVFLIDYPPWRAALCRCYADLLEDLLSRFDDERDALLMSAPDGALAKQFAMQAQANLDTVFNAELRALTAPWIAARTPR